MSKINPPKMNAELFEIVGYEYKRFEWTDKQLGEHIAVLECIVRYFKGRDDARIIYSTILQQYYALLGFKVAREQVDLDKI